MRKYISIFLISIIVCLFSVVNIYAEDDTLSPTTDSELEVQKQSIESYCDQVKQITGCIFDSSDLYMKSSKQSFSQMFDSSRGFSLSISVPKNQNLIRGYQTFDGQGNAIFAGCYRYKKDANEKKDSELGGNGTYFLFEIIAQKGKKCVVKTSTLIPAQGVKRFSKSGSSRYEIGTYDGQTSVNGDKVATFNEWVAVEGGDCPKVFGYATNVKKLTPPEYKYFFSENEHDFTIKTYSFWGKDKIEEGRPGCTVEDVDGKEKAQELLNGVLNEIKNTSCPSKIEDMSSFSGNFESWYESLRKNNDYRLLWSSGLIDEVTHGSAEVQIREAISEKITDCQYNICNVTSKQKEKIKSNLGSDCKKGCSLTVIFPQSSSPGSSCFCCSAGLPSCVLQWTSTPENGCSPYSSVSKDQCIGTKSDLLCRSCLLKAYEKAGLSDEQKSCLSGSEIAKEITESNIQNSNSDAAGEDKRREIEENKELREDIYDRLQNGGEGGNVAFNFDIPVGDLRGCSQILGKNLTALVKASITILQIIAAIIAIVKGMMVLIPPILSHDSDALKKATKTLVTMAIILVIIFIFKPLLKFIGSILEFDTSCIL